MKEESRKREKLTVVTKRDDRITETRTETAIRTPLICPLPRRPLSSLELAITG